MGSSNQGGGGYGAPQQQNNMQSFNPPQGMGGAMLRNPFLDQTFDRAADSVDARMRNATQFQGLSNSGVQQMHGRNMNDLATGVYGGAYDADANRRQQAGVYMSQMQQQARENDLNRMMSAAQGMPGYLASAAQFPLGLGDIERSFGQQGINEAIRAFDARAQWPYRQADVLGRAIAGSMGAGGTTSSVVQSPGMYQPSSTAGMLGTALTGAGLLSAFNK